MSAPSGTPPTGPNYPDTMKTANRNMGSLYWWLPVPLVGLGWRLIYRDTAQVVMYGVLAAMVVAFVLWRLRRNRGAGAMSPAECRAATEARWAQGAAEAREREAERAAEYERATEQRRREAAARREAEAAAGRPARS